MKITGGMFGEDTGWRNYFDECPIIKIDGECVKCICEADDVEGYVIVECRDTNGKLMLDHGTKGYPNMDSCIKTERLNGVVEIIGLRRSDIAA